MLKLKISALLLAVFTSSSCLAASSGIANNWTNECSIWLCLPGGFPGGCEAAHSSYIYRLTTFTHGKHPKRVWSSIPAFGECDDDGQTKSITDILGVEHPATKMTYQEREDAHIPTHDQCTALIPQYRYEYDGGSRERVFIGYRCGAWEHVEEHYEEGTRCNFPKANWFGSWSDDSSETVSYGGRIISDSFWVYDLDGNRIDSNASPKWCDKTVTSTIVYGDGIQYGEIWRQAHD